MSFTLTIFSGKKIIVEEKSRSFSTATKTLPTWFTVLFVKLVVVQLIKKFPVVGCTCKCVTMDY